jgi:5S rRNA maturation endonuclease (ribonuclease M5)
MSRGIAKSNYSFEDKRTSSMLIDHCPNPKCGADNKDGKIGVVKGSDGLHGYCRKCGEWYDHRSSEARIEARKNRVIKRELPFAYFSDVSLERFFEGDWLDQNNLIVWLKTLFPTDKVMEAIRLYRVGWYYKGYTMFSNYDKQGFRTAKCVMYDPKTGKTKYRDRMDWDTGEIKRGKDIHYPKEYTQKYHETTPQGSINRVKRCAFGLHLIEPGKEVVVVESEKTAIIGHLYNQDMIWIATGGTAGMNEELARALRYNDVKVLFDNDDPGYESAERTVEYLDKFGVRATDITWNLFVEHREEDDERERNGLERKYDKWDIGDVIVNEIKEDQSTVVDAPY